MSDQMDQTSQDLCPSGDQLTERASLASGVPSVIDSESHAGASRYTTTEIRSHRGLFHPSSFQDQAAEPTPSVCAHPAFELLTGYTRLTLTPDLTRVSVARMHYRLRDVLAMAALIIRADLAPITRRLQGNPKIADDGTINVELLDRLGRRRHAITVTPADIVAHLRDWTIA